MFVFPGFVSDRQKSNHIHDNWQILTVGKQILWFYSNRSLRKNAVNVQLRKLIWDISLAVIVSSVVVYDVDLSASCFCTGISNPEKIFKPQASLTPSTAHAGGGSGLTFSVGQIGQSFASNFLNLCMPFTILEASLKCHDDVKAGGLHTFLGETSFAFTRNAASSVLPSP